MLLKYELVQSLFCTVLFWLAGYLFCGAIALASNKKQKVRAPVQDTEPIPPSDALARSVQAPAAKNTVRLEHALSLIERLLSKSLGKGDRQELEKLKATLGVLRIKGTLSPAEAENLNDNFNMLLKLMAKYNA